MTPKKRTILITGGNGAMGQAIARAFLQENELNFVCLGVRNNQDRARLLMAEHPERCSLAPLEVSDKDAWNDAVLKVTTLTGSLDVLVNNSGAHHDCLLATMPWEKWREVLSGNLDGTFLGCQAVLSQMISQRQGRIINISSLSALLAPAGQSNYAAAKAGVVALTQSLAKEVARLNITVNAVCPGYIETNALESLSPEERKAAQMRIPMRRFGRPEEVTAAVRFLASPEASYITGSIIKVDGGIF